MQATPSPSALAASDELSQAPVCQGGRAHGVYAPVHDEEAPDAVHGSLGFNPLLQASGAMTDAAESGAFGASRGQHATATAGPRRMSAAPLSATHGEPQADAAVDKAWEDDDAAAYEELRLMQQLEALRMARSTRTYSAGATASQQSREVKLEVHTPAKTSSMQQAAGQDVKPENAELGGAAARPMRRLTLPPPTQQPRAMDEQHSDMLQLMEQIQQRLGASEADQAHQQQMQQIQQAALAALASRPREAKSLKDLTTAELTSLRCGMRPHEIDAWLTRATARLCARCKELRGIIDMPDEAWLLLGEIFVSLTMS